MTGDWAALSISEGVKNNTVLWQETTLVEADRKETDNYSLQPW